MSGATFILFLCCSCLSIISGFDTDREKNTFDDPDWWRKYFTTEEPYEWNRWDWKKFTLPPREYDYLSKKDNSGIYFGIGLIIFFIAVALFSYLKFVYDESHRNSRYDALSSFENGQSVSSHRSSLPNISSTVNTESLHTVVDFNNPLSDSSSISSPVDRPPRYDEVVHSDLIGQKQYAEVKPFVIDTPPPQYEESNTDRY